MVDFSQFSYGCSSTFSVKLVSGDATPIQSLCVQINNDGKVSSEIAYPNIDKGSSPYTINLGKKEPKKAFVDFLLRGFKNSQCF